MAFLGTGTRPAAAEDPCEDCGARGAPEPRGAHRWPRPVVHAPDGRAVHSATCQFPGITSLWNAPKKPQDAGQVHILRLEMEGPRKEKEHAITFTREYDDARTLACHVYTAKTHKIYL